MKLYSCRLLQMLFLYLSDPLFYPVFLFPDPYCPLLSLCPHPMYSVSDLSLSEQISNLLFPDQMHHHSQLPPSLSFPLLMQLLFPGRILSSLSDQATIQRLLLLLLCSSSSYLFLLLKSYTLQNHFYYSLLLSCLQSVCNL